MFTDPDLASCHRRQLNLVVMVYKESPQGRHIISLRKAEKHEARYYRQVAKENLCQGQ